MTKHDQRRIVNALCAGQKKKLVEMLPRVPKNWDGIELRNWFADVAVEGLRYDMGHHRARDYRNDRYNHNL